MIERLRLVQQAVWNDAFDSLKSPFPLQKPALYYPGLQTREVHDPGIVNWVPRLAAAYPAIRQELEQVLRERSGFIRVFEEDTAEGEWAAFLFNLYGHVLEDNCRRCPNTAAFLETLPGGKGGLTCFSALKPGTHIAPHCGPSNARLRCHLPLIVPQGCKLRIGSQSVPWEEGKPLLFDDSFEHEAWNPTDRVRIVLMFDFPHPDLTDEEEQCLMFLQSAFARDGYVKKLLRSNSPAPDWVYD